MRAIFEEHGQGLGIEIAEDKYAAHNWKIAGHGGGMWSIPRGGAIIGKRAHVLISDDLVKGEKESLSKLQRDHAWDWYRSTWRTRLEPDGIEVMIITRWHEDDIAGRCLRLHEDGVERWDVLSLPALAEDDDALGRAAGEALWPDRYPVEMLEEEKRRQSARMWDAVYQQRPSAIEGTLFHEGDVRYFTETDDAYELRGQDGEIAKLWPKSACWLFLTADLAASLKESADYTVMSVWAVTPDKDLLLLAVERRRLEGPDQLLLLETLNVTYSLRVSCIEAVQYQLTLVQHAARKGLRVEAVPVHKDKFARAQGPASLMRLGKVHFRRGASWLPALLEELLSFPYGEHDDQVDNLSMAADKVSKASKAGERLAPVIRSVGRRAVSSAGEHRRAAAAESFRDPRTEVF